jgi:hypothetical protein
MSEIESIDTSVEADLAERALEFSKARQKWDSIKDLYRPIVRAIQKLEIEPRLSNDIDVNFTGDAHKLAAVVRILRTNGFSTTYAPPEAGKSEWYAYYSHPKVDVKVWLHFTSSVCRRVKIGTKMVEQDIYETVCGEVGVENQAS